MAPKNSDPVLGMILKGFPRISETFISNEILLLERLGFKIRIFSMRDPRESFCHDSVKQIQAQVDYLPKTIREGFFTFLYHNALLAVSSPGPYWGAVKAAFRRFCRTRKSATLKHLLQGGYVVHKLLPGQGIVHFHAHFAHSPTSVAMFSSFLSGLPFSFFAHAKDIYTSDPRQLREKIALAKFVVTCTGYNKDHLKRLAQNSRTPIHRMYHGIDLSLFGGKTKDDQPSPPYRIFTIARMVPKKGLPTVYRALKILKERGVAFQHTLIGDGDEREKILALIKALNLSDCCRWLGTLPHEKVLDHFRRSDVFVLGCEIAGTGDRDGIPNVFVEAMAMGVPVVATNVSAIPELVFQEKTGLLVKPGRPEELADAMIRMLTDGPLRGRVIPAAKAFVGAHFDNRRLIRNLADIYRENIPVWRGG